MDGNPIPRHGSSAMDLHASERLFHPPHPSGFRRPLVIIPEEVEDAVNHQAGDLTIETVAPLRRLAAGRLGRNHDVPQEGRRATGLGGFDLPREPQREGEDIGGTVLAPVDAIKAADSRIVDEGQADFGLRPSEPKKNLFGQSGEVSQP